MLLIGSKALDYFNISYPLRQGKIQDTDYLTTEVGFQEYLAANEGKIVHVESKDSRNLLYKTVFQIGSYPIEFKIDEELYNLVIENGLYEVGEDSAAVLPSVVLALKLSHRYLKNSPHFLKTLKDINFLRDLNYTVPESLKSWLKEEEKRVLSYHHPNLNRNKKDFFVDIYPYDHDSIHKCVAVFDKPAYEYYKYDDKEVLCSKDLFFSGAEEIRLAGVLEESLVLALERHQIPNNFKYNPEASFLIALEKVCTSITSGWFREFAYDNYFKVVEFYHQHRENYVEKFQEDFEKGLILPYAT